MTSLLCVHWCLWIKTWLCQAYLCVHWCTAHLCFTPVFGWRTSVLFGGYTTFCKLYSLLLILRISLLFKPLGVASDPPLQLIAMYPKNAPKLGTQEASEKPLRTIQPKEELEVAGSHWVGNHFKIRKYGHYGRQVFWGFGDQKRWHQSGMIEWDELTAKYLGVNIGGARALIFRILPWVKGSMPQDQGTMVNVPLVSSWAPVASIVFRFRVLKSGMNDRPMLAYSSTHVWWPFQVLTHTHVPKKMQGRNPAKLPFWHSLDMHDFFSP